MLTKTLLIFTLAIICTVTAKDWYVSQTRGNDNNEGSQSQPFATVKKAYTSLDDEDSIHLEVGNYQENNLKTDKSFNIIGIKQQEKYPFISGSLQFKGAKNTISGIQMESKVMHALDFYDSDFVKITDCLFTDVRCKSFLQLLIYIF